MSKIPQAGCAAGRSCSINSWTDCRPCGANVRPEFLAESRNIRPRNCCARFLHRSDSSGAIDCADANPASVPQQAATMDLQWLGIETHDSAQFRFVSGQLQRSKKPQQIRGLNRNHNHEMKEIFKSGHPGQLWQGTIP